VPQGGLIGFANRLSGGAAQARVERMKRVEDKVEDNKEEYK
jgi:hypothetical protein